VSTQAADHDPITHARILRIALPILLAYITVPLIGLVDTGVVGQIPSPEPIAAVGVGAIVLSAVYWIFGFLRMGTTGLVAQALGQNDHEEVAALFTRAVLVGLAGGLGLIVLQLPVFAGAFWISPASAEVEGLARAYMQIRIWSAPAAIAIYGITGWLIAQERTREVLIVQFWMNGVNVALDLLFVVGLNWGVEGVALATFLAEWSALALGLFLCRDVFARPAWRAWGLVLRATRLKRMAVVNSDILIRSVLLQAIFVSFLLLGGKFGDTVLAANQVLLQFLYVTGYALDGFAFAAEALVGQAFGAGQRARLRRAVWMNTVWASGFAVALSLIFALWGGWGIEVLTKDPQVQEAARRFLPWMVAAPILQIGLTMLDGIFIGATRTADMRNMMVVTAAFYFASAYALMPVIGNHGLWAALMVSFVVRGVTLGLRYPALERSVRAG
jgi:MATE family multidrug resistance protein